MDFKVDQQGLRRIMRSQAVRAILLEHARPVAARNSSESLALMHGPHDRPPYIAEPRLLQNTGAAVIHSTTKAAAAVGRAHGLPHW